MQVKQEKKNTKTVWNYSGHDGGYLGESEALPDPMDEGKFLVPAYATIVPVPDYDDTEFEIPVFNPRNNRWMISPDYRGQIIWATDPDAPLEEKVVEEIGAIPEGWTLKPRPEHSVWDNSKEEWVQDSKLLNEAKIAQTLVEVITELYNPVTYKGHSISGTPESQMQISNIINLYTKSTAPKKIYLFDTEANVLEFTYDEVKEILELFTKRNQEKIKKIKEGDESNS